MRLCVCLPLLLVACSAGSGEPEASAALQQTGRLANKKLDEASGIANSRLQDDLYWAVNDDGPAVIHALSSSGAKLGRVKLRGAENRDWEDIAAFEHEGTAYLVVADIGDNDAKHTTATLYVVAEPKPDAETVENAWQIKFSYPGGPRDAESLAVDADNAAIYVLSKRTVPAELYRLPLRPSSAQVVTATLVMPLTSLPQPSAAQLQNASGSGYGWQPTAMDFAPDGSSALILTYDGINLFMREPGQSWQEAFAGQALHLSLGRFENAEAITYTADSKHAVVTTEGKHAPVLKAPLLR